MNGVRGWESDFVAEYVEVDPTGRYGRYNQVLGKGASKIVYKAFDEYEGIEVAWNQVKLTDFLQKPEDLERLYSEIHLLKTLKHSNIMKFYASWVDISNRNINFVTEMFTSGTLRQYRLKHKKVNIRAVKHWCRQILKGLLYLHNLDPPVIHRDLKCDNIFINGNQGQVKIGDLGLAAILRQSHAAHCVVGTPEFMAPEIYAEEYNELVDIYSFGMCVLEMVTFEYPYSECTHPAQIYKKVISGKRPESLYKVKDPEVRQFVEKCLATVSSRLPARELLKDPFLQTDGKGYDLRPIDYERDYEETTVPPHLVREVSFTDTQHQYDGSLLSSCSDYDASYYEHEDEVLDCEADHGFISRSGDFDISMSPDRDNVFSSTNAEITIKGTQKDDGDIFLRLRIADREGRVRNIYFPFDLENDTALSVANEMVAELDITEQDAMSIADIIDGEIASLVPDWQKKGLKTNADVEEEQVAEQQQKESSSLSSSPATLVNIVAGGKQHQRSGSFLADYVLPDNPYVQNLQVLHCSGKAPSSHGRFEEVTYQVESAHEQLVVGKDDNEDAHDPHVPSSPSCSQSIGRHFTDVMALHDDVCESFKRLSFKKNDRMIIDMDVETPRKGHQNPRTPYNSPATSVVGPDYENGIRKELRWLKAKYQMQLRELRDQQLMAFPGFKEYQVDSPTSEIESTTEKKIGSGRSRLRKKFSIFLAPGFHHDRKPSNRSFINCPSSGESHGDEEPLAVSKIFCNESLLPHSLHRATSLPVDAVDC